MEILTKTPENWVENESAYTKHIANEEIWNLIPLLNVNDLQNLKHSTLVRFRGMVQDMYDPEYYYEKYTVVNEKTAESAVKSGKYVDTNYCKNSETFDLESSECVLSERHTLVVISAPAANDWVQHIETKKFKLANAVSSTSPTSSTKRALEENEMETEETLNNQNNKKTRVMQTPSVKKPTVSSDHILNFPLVNRIGKTCHLKMYQDDDQIKLNDFCEFVGFLSVDPILSHETLESEEYNKMELETHHPPPSLIPRIHCVSWKKLPHNNPLVGDFKLPSERMRSLKTELLVVLTQLLLGDRLAAEYFLYHLLSTVYIRKDFLAIGKFSLNISNIRSFANGEYPKELYSFIELLLPQSHYMPMTLENMNDLSFTPKKDYERNRLTSGVLQLNGNTHFVLDETKLQTGKLNEPGVKAVGALARVIKSQTVEYDFGFNSTKEFECDIPVLILSEGKSLLPSDCQVPLQPDEECLRTFAEIVEAAKHFLSGDLLNEIRVYLTCARMGKYEISDTCNEMVENEFVNMRQNGFGTPDDLHQLLVLSRLICLSEGKTSLDEDAWKKACDLELERKRRLKITV